MLRHHWFAVRSSSRLGGRLVDAPKSPEPAFQQNRFAAKAHATLCGLRIDAPLLLLPSLVQTRQFEGFLPQTQRFCKAMARTAEPKRAAPKARPVRLKSSCSNAIALICESVSKGCVRWTIPAARTKPRPASASARSRIGPQSFSRRASSPAGSVGEVAEKIGGSVVSNRLGSRLASLRN